LIIDDDADICGVLVHLLERTHQLVIASNGADAIELIRGGDRFDVILSDVMMPRLDGVQLYRQLVELAPESLSSNHSPRSFMMNRTVSEGHTHVFTLVKVD
jgi:CheY-like chemotaxis protein